MKPSKLREIIKEVLDEMSVTGAVGGFLTPYAFSKNTNKATKYLQKLGYKKVERPKRPSNTGMFAYLNETDGGAFEAPFAFTTEEGLHTHAGVKITEKLGMEIVDKIKKPTNSKVKNSQKTDNKNKK